MPFDEASALRHAQAAALPSTTPQPIAPATPHHFDEHLALRHAAASVPRVQERPGALRVISDVLDAPMDFINAYQEDQLSNQDGRMSIAGHEIPFLHMGPHAKQVWGRLKQHDFHNLAEEYAPGSPQFNERMAKLGDPVAKFRSQRPWVNAGLAALEEFANPGNAVAGEGLGLASRGLGTAFRFARQASSLIDTPARVLENSAARAAQMAADKTRPGREMVTRFTSPFMRPLQQASGRAMKAAEPIRGRVASIFDKYDQITHALGQPARSVMYQADAMFGHRLKKARDVVQPIFNNLTPEQRFEVFRRSALTKDNNPLLEWDTAVPEPTQGPSLAERGQAVRAYYRDDIEKRLQAGDPDLKLANPDTYVPMRVFKTLGMNKARPVYASLPAGVEPPKTFSDVLKLRETLKNTPGLEDADVEALFDQTAPSVVRRGPLQAGDTFRKHHRHFSTVDDYLAGLPAKGVTLHPEFDPAHQMFHDILEKEGNVDTTQTVANNLRQTVSPVTGLSLMPEAQYHYTGPNLEEYGSLTEESGRGKEAAKSVANALRGDYGKVAMEDAVRKLTAERQAELIKGGMAPEEAARNAAAQADAASRKYRVNLRVMQNSLKELRKAIARQEQSAAYSARTANLVKGAAQSVPQMSDALKSAQQKAAQLLRVINEHGVYGDVDKVNSMIDDLAKSVDNAKGSPFRAAKPDAPPPGEKPLSLSQRRQQIRDLQKSLYEQATDPATFDSTVRAAAQQHGGLTLGVRWDSTKRKWVREGEFADVPARFGKLPELPKGLGGNRQPIPGNIDQILDVVKTAFPNAEQHDVLAVLSKPKPKPADFAEEAAKQFDAQLKGPAAKYRPAPGSFSQGIPSDVAGVAAQTAAGVQEAATAGNAVRRGFAASGTRAVRENQQALKQLRTLKSNLDAIEQKIDTAKASNALRKRYMELRDQALEDMVTKGLDHYTFIDGVPLRESEYVRASSVPGLSKVADAQHHLVHREVAKYAEAATAFGAPPAEAHGFAELFTTLRLLAQAQIVAWPVTHIIWNLGVNYLRAGGKLEYLAKLFSKEAGEGVWREAADKMGAVIPDHETAFGIGDMSSVDMMTRPTNELTTRGKIERGISEGLWMNVGGKRVPIMPGWKYNNKLVFGYFDSRYATMLFRSKVEEAARRAGFRGTPEEMIREFGGEAAMGVRAAFGDSNNITRSERMMTLTQLHMFYPWMKTTLQMWGTMAGMDPRYWQPFVRAISDVNEQVGDPGTTNPFSVTMGQDAKGRFKHLTLPLPQRFVSTALEAVPGPWHPLPPAGKQVPALGTSQPNLAPMGRWWQGHWEPVASIGYDIQQSLFADKPDPYHTAFDPAAPWPERIRQTAADVGKRLLPKVYDASKVPSDPAGRVGSFLFGGFEGDPAKTKQESRREYRIRAQFQGSKFGHTPQQREGLVSSLRRQGRNEEAELADQQMQIELKMIDANPGTPEYQNLYKQLQAVIQQRQEAMRTFMRGRSPFVPSQQGVSGGP